MCVREERRRGGGKKKRKKREKVGGEAIKRKTPSTAAAAATAAANTATPATPARTAKHSTHTQHGDLQVHFVLFVYPFSALNYYVSCIFFASCSSNASAPPPKVTLGRDLTRPNQVYLLEPFACQPIFYLQIGWAHVAPVQSIPLEAVESDLIGARSIGDP